MHVPRDLLDEKLTSLELVLPGLLAGASPEEHVLEFAQVGDDLLAQCMPEEGLCISETR